MADWFEDDVVASGYAGARPPIHGPILELALGAATVSVGWSQYFVDVLNEADITVPAAL